MRRRKQSNGTWAIMLIGTLMLIGLIMVCEMPHSPLNFVRLTVQCQDGTTRTIYAEDANTVDCVRVDSRGNLIRYDSRTGEQILIDPKTGERVEE